MSAEKDFLSSLRTIIGEKDRGFQADLCRKLKEDPSSFANKVAGRRKFTEEERIAISKLLGIDYAWIVAKNMESGQTITTGPVTGSQQVSGIVSQGSTTISIINGQHPPQDGHSAILSDLEFEVLTLFRKAGGSNPLVPTSKIKGLGDRKCLAPFLLA